jgi:hypothetical protein
MAENGNDVAAGMPMTLEQTTSEQRRVYLQDYHGIPVVLREAGGEGVVCLHCGKTHNHEPGPGHLVADCEEMDRNIGIVIVGMCFIPNYGYLCLEHFVDGGVNK